MKSSEQIASANRELREKTPLEIVLWALAQADGKAIVSTNFRPYEAVILHLAVQAQSDIPVLWVDHGYNRPATYVHAEIQGEIPTPENEAALKEFGTIFKLEPFQRGMREWAPTIWLTALRKVQNPNRAELDIVSEDKNFGTLKVSPLFYWSDAEMEDYLAKHDLPNEWDYFDPAKADEKRECGLHAAWGGKAMGV